MKELAWNRRRRVITSNQSQRELYSNDNEKIYNYKFYKFKFFLFFLFFFLIRFNYNFNLLILLPDLLKTKNITKLFLILSKNIQQFVLPKKFLYCITSVLFSFRPLWRISLFLVNSQYSPVNPNLDGKLDFQAFKTLILVRICSLLDATSYPLLWNISNNPLFQQLELRNLAL